MKILALFLVSCIAFNFHTPKKPTDYGNTKVLLAYPNFDVIIYDFGPYANNFYNIEIDNGEIIYNNNYEIDTSSLVPFLDSNLFLGFRVKADTALISEDVGDYVRGKLLQIAPKNKKDKFRISYAYHEIISELYQREKHNDIDWDEWAKNSVHWEGQSDYKTLKDSVKYFFWLPEADYEGYEKIRERKLNLRDTSVIEDGEYSTEATLVYKEKPCTHFLESLILKIERIRSRKVLETKYIKIILSYGC